jgi:hypothetical protein
MHALAARFLAVWAWTVVSDGSRASQAAVPVTERQLLRAARLTLLAAAGISSLAPLLACLPNTDACHSVVALVTRLPLAQCCLPFVVLPAPPSHSLTVV